MRRHVAATLKRGLILLAAAAAVLAGPVGGRAAPAPALRLAVAGAPVTVFDSAREGCARDDIPDLPLRAVRRADGSVAAIASDWQNRLLEGPSLAALQHHCRIVYQGAASAAPEAFDDRSWISSLWTADGRTIYALIHNEYHANEHPGRCQYAQKIPCWWNTVVLAKSTDGGETFARAPGAAALVAAPPFDQKIGQGRQRGFMRPSNIVQYDGAWYAFFFTPGYGPQRPGSCLFRTADIADPGAWRAWDGQAFSLKFGDPYAGGANATPCRPIPPFFRAVDAVVKVRGSPLWLAVFATPANPRLPDSGVYYATSRDLLHWSAPALLMKLDLQRREACASEPTYPYVSLLDPDATTRSFEDVDGHAYLFATRSEVMNCHPTMHRELVRWPITIERAP